MAQRCVSCGAENPATNRFCGQCGIRLEPANDATANTANAAISGNAIDGAPANSGEDQPLNKYRIVIESANPARAGFLGLSDDDTPDGTAPSYEDEEREAPSHLGRSIAISVVTLAVVLTAVLAAMQWRTIRDYNLRRHSLASVPDGSREAEPPNSSAVAADRASRTSGTPTPAVKAGASQVMESSPSANRARPVQQTGNSPEPAPLAANSNPSTDAVSPRAMGAPAADLIESQSPAVSNQPAKFRSAHTASDLSSTALPGAYEMNRAAHANDAEARAAWLWKAVGKGNPQASVELARMYVQGSGVVRNCDQAQILLRGAAEKGNEQAKLSLRQIRLQGGCAPR